MLAKRSNKRWMLLWFLPMMLVLLFFFLVPLVDAIRLSFTNTRVGVAESKTTLLSYKRVLQDPDLLIILKNTLFFVVITVTLQLFIGLLVGLLLETNLRGMGLLKLAMITAWVVPGVIAGIVWSLMFSTASTGVINNTLQLFGIDKISFLTNKNWALFAVIVVNVWKGTGFSGIMQYSALRAIDPQVYEAAAIDGAGVMQKFFKVTLPMLKPTLLINLVLITISTVNTYDAIWSLTQGGPGNSTTVLSLQTYKTTFLNMHIGQGSVYAVMMIGSSVILTSLYLKFLGDKDNA